MTVRMRVTGWVGVTVVAALALSGCTSSSHGKTAASSARLQRRVQRVAQCARVVTGCGPLRRPRSGRRQWLRAAAVIAGTATAVQVPARPRSRP